MNPRFAIIEAPSVLGLFPKGVETLADTLLGAGRVDPDGSIARAFATALGDALLPGD